MMMLFVKLTETVDESDMWFNVANIAAVSRSPLGSVITSVTGNPLAVVKETPEEVMQRIVESVEVPE